MKNEVSFPQTIKIKVNQLTVKAPINVTKFFF